MIESCNPLYYDYVQVTASGVHAEMQSSNTLNGGSTTSPGGGGQHHVVSMTADEEEEDEDAFHDDLPEIKPKQQRYLIQKYATLWFNKIKPGMVVSVLWRSVFFQTLLKHFHNANSTVLTD